MGTGTRGARRRLCRRNSRNGHGRASKAARAFFARCKSSGGIAKTGALSSSSATRASRVELRGMGTPHDIDARRHYRVAKQRYEDGKLLLEIERPAAAVYLTGYSVECILKALLLESVPRGQRPGLLSSFRGALRRRPRNDVPLAQRRDDPVQGDGQPDARVLCAAGGQSRSRGRRQELICGSSLSGGTGECRGDGWHEARDAQ